MTKYLQDLYRRRDLILYLVMSGLKAEHRNKVLGYFWWLLDPLLGALIYYFVVVIVFQRGDANFGANLIVGLIVWRWLSASVSASSKAIARQAGIITQVYLPKIVFPIAVSFTGLINFGFGLLVIVGLFLVWGRPLGSAVVWLPYAVAIQMLFTMALVTVVAYVFVFLRDTDALLGHFMRLWFFASPVIWSPSMMSDRGDRLGWLLDVNPMAHVIGAYRAILMDDRAPDLLPLFVIAVGSAAVLVLATYVYSQHEHRIIKAL